LAEKLTIVDNLVDWRRCKCDVESGELQWSVFISTKKYSMKIGEAGSGVKLRRNYSR